MTRMVNLYEAKTRLSQLVDEAAAGQEIVIAKNGVAKARLTPMPAARTERKPSDLLTITFIADDFDAVDDRVIADFEGSD